MGSIDKVLIHRVETFGSPRVVNRRGSRELQAAFPTVDRQWNAARTAELAVRSMLEYEDEPYAAIRSLSPLTQVIDLHRTTERECSIVRLEDRQVLTFRGTEPPKLLKILEERERKDVVTDAKIRRVRWHGEGRIHRGFAAAVDDVWDWILPRLVPGLPTEVTGHSLGAAMATAWVKRAMAEGAFAAGPWFRHVNGCDVVTRIPLSRPGKNGGYKHTGFLSLIDHKLRHSLDPSFWRVFKSRVRGRLSALLGGAPELVEVKGIPEAVVGELKAVGLESAKDILDADPIALVRVKGVGKVLAARLKSWADMRTKKGLRDALTDGLHDHGSQRYATNFKVIATRLV